MARWFAFVDFMGLPGSLREMVREVDAVVVVTYTGRGHLIEEGPPDVTPFTNQVFVVSEA